MTLLLQSSDKIARAIEFNASCRSGTVSERDAFSKFPTVLQKHAFGIAQR
jgi:hypothetical protein